MLSSFGFASIPRSRKAAWARKPAIRKNRITYKPYGYFSFGSDVREATGNYSPAGVPSGTGPPVGRRPARPLTRKLIF
ncbi:Uncharacterised protein [Rikenella microfusus]|uniref:Uncharacterized protein n=1 Tax=Rikenella microfusus TaxID=28139 RepID=A0A379MPB4_9BACT|nr:Uncharacterised protein [Rikenella microfusus]